MHANNWLRGLGILGIVAAYAVFVQFGDVVQGLLIAVGGILSLVAPEVMDQINYGPDKT